ncbi:MAG: hypothetical protein PHC97_01090 [Patescibacteria group bacterium]|nr:hypothetical protein [Patescibacteria group bacterium]
MPDRGLEEKQLSAAYWFVTRKLLLRKILVIVLIILNVAVFAALVYYLVANLFLGQSGYESNLSAVVLANPDYALLRESKLPSSLQVANLRTLPNSTSFDILADLNNPNAVWAATFNYQFKIGDNVTPVKKGFIFPAESKTVFNLDIDNGNLVSQLILSDVVWQKEIDFQTIYKDRFRFDLSGVKFIPSSELGLGQKLSISRVQFDVSNSSAFNYANVNFIAFLYSAGTLAAINQVSSGDLLSGQTKNLETTFFQKLPNIDSVKVVPEVNILDSGVFLKF